MPPVDKDGKVVPGKGNAYYCDAMKSEGAYCPDFDVMEANSFAWHTTPHKCDAPDEKGHYSNCDVVGACFQTAWEQDKDAYGPGKRIDTTKPFHVKIEFDLVDHFTTSFS